MALEWKAQHLQRRGRFGFSPNSLLLLSPYELRKGHQYEAMTMLDDILDMSKHYHVWHGTFQDGESRDKPITPALFDGILRHASDSLANELQLQYHLSHER